jgi:cobalt/nickel transport system permease protein
LHHVVLERWSQGGSSLHQRDPRAKTIALLVFLVALATSHRGLPLISAGFFLLLAGAFVWARLPLGGVLLRAAVVLPFSVLFGLICWLAGDPARGLSLIAKSYLSTLAVLLVISTTPFPVLLKGLESTGVPRFLLLVGQFLYRYLFVIGEEAQHMRKASAARGATLRQWAAGGAGFRSAAGALSVLFARSYGRAEQIHQAMAARGFSGHFQPLQRSQFRPRDAAFTTIACLVPILLRIAVERAAP